MAGVFDVEYEKVELWGIKRCILIDGKYSDSSKNCFRTLVKCKCEDETKNDTNLVQGDPSDTKCSDAACNMKATLICIYCDKVFCRPCGKLHFIYMDHNPKLIMPFPAIEKKIFFCNGCNKEDEYAEAYCKKCNIFICSSCLIRYHRLHYYKCIVYIDKEMRLEYNSEIYLAGPDNMTDAFTPTNAITENADSGRVPVKRSTRFMDYILATSPSNKQIMIRNRSKYYPVTAADPSASESITVCACCGRKAEVSIKCNSCARHYHNECHIPPVREATTDKKKWKCTMCTNIEKLPPATNDEGDRSDLSLTANQNIIAQRILMELYCQGENSQHYEDCPAREKCPQYYQIIANPVSLNDIRKHLVSKKYTSFGDFVKDLRMMFANGLLYYWSGDARHNAAMNLRYSLNEMLRRWTSKMVPDGSK